ncbi:hypothetical protein D3C72_1507540 [compost metagenome]
MLGDIGRVQIGARGNPAAHGVHGQIEPRCAAQVTQEIGDGDTFIHAGCRFGQPDKGRPHRHRLFAVAPHQQPFEQGHRKESPHAKHDACHGQIQHHCAPAACRRERHGIEHNGVARSNHQGVRRANAEGLDEAPPQDALARGCKGQVIGVALHHFARRQIHRGRADPGLAVLHVGIARHGRHHTDEHAFRDGGAIGHIGPIADEAAA